VAEIIHHTAGWHVHLEDLAAHVAGGAPGSWEDRWRELIPSYADRGPEGD
jgi:hypothetical protein